MKSSIGFLALIALAACGCGNKEDVKSPESAKGVTKLKITDTTVGTGEGVAAGDTVSVIYTGKLADGSTFDSNVGKDPTKFAIGNGQVIKGWDQGLIGMKVGGKRHLDIPFALGYGEKGQEPKIPANADLFFDIELKAITKPGDMNKVVIDEIAPGSGETIKVGDTVSVDYIVKGANGKELQNSKESIDRATGKVIGPFTFVVGDKKKAIMGIDYAIRSMKLGGKYRVHLPAMYGPQKTVEDMPPGDSVDVDLTVLSVKHP